MTYRISQCQIRSCTPTSSNYNNTYRKETSRDNSNLVTWQLLQTSQLDAWLRLGNFSLGCKWSPLGSSSRDQKLYHRHRPKAPKPHQHK
eukprot:5392210-Amphidinium_carterae.1